MKGVIRIDFPGILQRRTIDLVFDSLYRTDSHPVDPFLVGRGSSGGGRWCGNRSDEGRRRNEIGGRSS
jgi:hypothetical protein